MFTERLSTTPDFVVHQINLYTIFLLPSPLPHIPQFPPPPPPSAPPHPPLPPQSPSHPHHNPDIELVTDAPKMSLKFLTFMG